MTNLPFLGLRDARIPVLPLGHLGPHPPTEPPTVPQGVLPLGIPPYCSTHHQALGLASIPGLVGNPYLG